MSTMELETHILLQFRTLPQVVRVQVADYIEFLAQRYSDPPEQIELADDKSFDEHLMAIIERDKPLLEALAKA